MLWRRRKGRSGMRGKGKREDSREMEGERKGKERGKREC